MTAHPRSFSFLDLRMESLAGRLLIATPDLLDGNFARAVIYICSHSEEGAFGLVLNRAVEDSDLIDLLPAWATFASEPRLLFQGGPVEPESAFALVRAEDEPPPSWAHVAGPIGLVPLSTDPADFGLLLSGLRIYGGYAGWSAGQLDGEVEQKAWFVVDAEPVDLFTNEPDTLYRRVLRRQAGKLAMYAFFPENPRQN